MVAIGCGVFGGVTAAIATGAGVCGLHTGTGAAVRGEDTLDATTKGKCIGVEGLLTNTANPSAALDGSTTGTGPALLAEQKNTSTASPAINAKASGLGQAVLAANTAAAALPTIQTSSLSAVPALQATGKVVPAGGAVSAAGNAAALTVQGVAKFTRSGIAIVSATFNSVVVNVAGGLTATSHVLATMQTHLPSGTPRVLAVVPNPATGKITIYLDAPVPSMKTVTIAWFVFG